MSLAINTAASNAQAILATLKTTDRKVRTHEQAHLAAAGPYATSGASYTYERGPDGVQYAVAGEVGIDAAPVTGDPEATISKMQTVIAAANAPADPSAQDRAVAAQAAAAMATAQAELTQKKRSAYNDDAPPKGQLIDVRF